MRADDELLAALRRLGLLEEGERPAFAALRGGVSSDIWKVDTRRRTLCVKRALFKLKVAADWQAPVERNAYEAAWMAEAAAVVPDAVPELLGQDAASGVLAMAYLPPEGFSNWKEMLRRGQADPATAAAVGDRLVRIHAATAHRPEVAARFPTDSIFYDIRLEPYLVATAGSHPDVADALMRLVDITQASKHCLVHGDVSPKNILIGDKGPVFLDAECAWYGDPAFDLAFGLNHLLLKGLWVPAAKPAFLACFGALQDSYFKGVDWEDRERLEARTAALLPGLMLGRVDGKSPVEYLTEERDRDRVRAIATGWLLDPPKRLAAIREGWARKTGDGDMAVMTGETR
ncbi:MAG: phosphotransferase [Alphaproteobacteria bacterium]